MKKFLIRQQGISAIIVVVLMTLFGLFGTYMLSMTSISSLNTTQSSSAMQVWFAARSGVEWAVQQSLTASDGGCACAINCCNGINGQTLNFAEAGLNGYSTTITCGDQPFSEAAANYCVYSLVSTATNNSAVQLTSVARTISLSISDRNAP